MLQRLRPTRSKTGRISIEDRHGHFHTIIDEVGNRYSRLTVLRFVEMSDSRTAVFLCQCSCGNLTEVGANSLRMRDIHSCGCWRREVGARRGAGCVGRGNPNFKHGRYVSDRARKHNASI